MCAFKFTSIMISLLLKVYMVHMTDKVFKTIGCYLTINGTKSFLNDLLSHLN